MEHVTSLSRTKPKKKIISRIVVDIFRIKLHNSLGEKGMTKIARVPSKDFDQPAHPTSLISL